MASEVQTLLFERSEWTMGEARRWALSHGFVASTVHPTARYFRIRQFPPDPSMRYRTIEFGHGRGIKAVVAWPPDADPVLEAAEIAAELADELDL